MDITAYIFIFSSLIFYPLSKFNPVLSALILSLLTSLTIALIQKVVFSKKGVRELKIKLDEMKEKLVKERNEEKLNEMLSQVIKLNQKLLKENLKVLILSIFIGVLVIVWISHNYSKVSVSLPLPFLNKISLLYFYIMSGVIISFVLSKFLEVV